MNNGAMAYSEAHPVMRSRVMQDRALELIEARLIQTRPLDATDAAILSALSQVVMASLEVLKFEKR